MEEYARTDMANGLSSVEPRVRLLITSGYKPASYDSHDPLTVTAARYILNCNRTTAQNIIFVWSFCVQLSFHLPTSLCTPCYGWTLASERIVNSGYVALFRSLHLSRDSPKAGYLHIRKFESSASPICLRFFLLFFPAFPYYDNIAWIKKWISSNPYPPLLAILRLWTQSYCY